MPAAADGAAAPRRRPEAALPRDNARSEPRPKWADPDRTATGKTRARVAPTHLETLWFNTGTLCNIECANCYIESSPRNDRLAYLSAAEVRGYLDEIEREEMGTREIGFTGGEPFLNPELLSILEEAMGRGLRCLVLTNAMKPLMNKREELEALRARFGELLRLRGSIDHHSRAVHDRERGAGSFDKALAGLRWLAAEGFHVSVAGRSLVEEDAADAREGYARLFAENGISLKASDPDALVIFPEMDERADLPEITTECWGILKKEPSSVMCASSRMVVKRRGDAKPVVVACTLIPYDERFSMGRTLKESWRPVSLTHPHCASFCVLGGASCGG